MSPSVSDTPRTIRKAETDRGVEDFFENHPEGVCDRASFAAIESMHRRCDFVSLASKLRDGENRRGERPVSRHRGVCIDTRKGDEDATAGKSSGRGLSPGHNMAVRDVLAQDARRLGKRKARESTMSGQMTSSESVMADVLMSRARAGDAVAFQKLTEPHRRELHVHCYRMLGCLQDAEDTLQETLLAAWQGLKGFEGRASLRTWLYRIATNRCLNARRSASRRPAKAWDIPGVEPPEPTRLGEVPWLDPFPDSLLDERATDAPLSPEVRYLQTESISLAFVAALQVLPRRQLAVLILSDILDFEASEVARMIGSTVDSANSALKRARSNLQQRMQTSADRPRPPAVGSSAEEAIVAKFVQAYEGADLDALMALFTDDVFMSMPPIPLEYEGRDPVARFCAMLFRAVPRSSLVPTRANGQPAFGAYVHSASGVSQGVGVIAVSLSGERICALTFFEQSALPWFGLPLSLPASAADSRVR
jgi:RNA polymerase sigma-70 factor (TIGR02960 family)